MVNRHCAFSLMLTLNLYCLFQIVMIVALLVNDVNTCVPKEDTDDCLTTFLIMFDLINIISVPVNIIILLVLGIYNLINVVRRDTEMTQSISENNTVKTKIGNQINEIAILQRQLANGRIDRRPARVEHSPPLRIEQKNERERLLTGTRSSDYEAVQYIPFRIDN